MILGGRRQLAASVVVQFLKFTATGGMSFKGALLKYVHRVRNAQQLVRRHQQVCTTQININILC